jgi:hypothetical protein
MAAIRSGYGRLYLDLLSVGDGDELALGPAILAQRLDAKRRFLQRLDAGFVIVARIFVRLGGGHAAAPDPRDPGLVAHRPLHA